MSAHARHRQVMKASRSAFFAWRQRQANPTTKMADDIELAELIVKIHDQSHATYGRPRVTAELRLGLGRAEPQTRVTPDARAQPAGHHPPATHEGLHPQPCSDDLVKRQFRPDGPDRLWVQDIT
jgi:transposase InsO family protein